MLIGRLFPDRNMQAEALSNTRLALLDPTTFQAELDALLAPWQEALDHHIDAVRVAGEQAVGGRRPKSAVQAAQARVDYIEASQKSFFGPNGLLAFLRGSPERIALVVALQARLDEDQQAGTEVELQDLATQGADKDVAIARKLVDQANQQVVIAETRFRSALAQPPLQLGGQLLAGTMTLARLNHQRALDAGLAIARQLLRLTRLISGDAGQDTRISKKRTASPSCSSPSSTCRIFAPSRCRRCCPSCRRSTERHRLPGSREGAAQGVRLATNHGDEVTPAGNRQP